MAAFPRVYSSFSEFERDELRKLDSMHTTLNDMLEEHFSEENLFDQLDEMRGRGRRRSR